LKTASYDFSDQDGAALQLVSGAKHEMFKMATIWTISNKFPLRKSKQKVILGVSLAESFLCVSRWLDLFSFRNLAEGSFCLEGNKERIALNSSTKTPV